ncbi:hypothetical protein, partial [Tychonema sp. BBK16]
EVVVPVDEVVVPVDEVVVAGRFSNKNNGSPLRKAAGTALGIIPPPYKATQRLNNRLSISFSWVGILPNPLLPTIKFTILQTVNSQPFDSA